MEWTRPAAEVVRERGAEVERLLVCRPRVRSVALRCIALSDEREREREGGRERAGERVCEWVGGYVCEGERVCVCAYVCVCVCVRVCEEERERGCV